MQGLKIFALVLISLALVVCGWVYQAGMGAEKTVLSAAYYKDLSSELAITDRLYEGLQAYMREQLLSEMPVKVPAKLVEALDETLIQVFPKDWFEEQALLAVDDILAWIKGEQAAPSAVIDLRESKERLEDLMLKNLKEAAADAPAAFTLPPGGLEVLVKNAVKEMDLPDELSLAELLQEDMIPPEAEASIARLRFFRGHFQITPYIVFVLLLFFSCLLAGLPGGLKWFGAAALISGAVFFLGLQLLRGVFMVSLIAGLQGEVPIQSEALISVAGYTVSRFSTVPLVFAAGGLVLLVIGIILGKIFPRK